MSKINFQITKCFSTLFGITLTLKGIVFKIQMCKILDINFISRIFSIKTDLKTIYVLFVQILQFREHHLDRLNIHCRVHQQ